ncbi:HipA domain-containing protein [Gracilimonas sp. BCB1]|uniref:HipA domain-containing protein n=1 Tax=Gracilimonas sp. BCB1 TaxID=3152362 RepID=UPI0032D90513
MSRCLICLETVEGTQNYHSKCLKEMFGNEVEPELEYNFEELNELAKKSVHQRVTVPGVQAKLSLEIQKKTKESNKLTIVGLWGRFILKPPSNHWPELPENEHCTMLMAEAAGIEVVRCGLIYLASGEKAYITKRIDRDDRSKKFAMEDMCQLSGRMTEDKYKGSHEQIAKIIKKYSENPVFDLTRFFELILFTYLTGNGDMHLKNFSLFKDPMLGWKLSPAYDLLSTRLVIPEEKDPEELALTLTGKKSNFHRSTFRKYGKHIGLNNKQIESLIEKMKKNKTEFRKIISKSFLSDEKKEAYHKILEHRFQALN